MTPLLWTLIAIQVAMGAFDTLYHHELTERLAWRASQRHELQLHGIRNFFYALLFLVLGWLEVHGVFAIVIIAVLAAELVITLMDFVEEDLSRKLPASERINHTLLALNYGAILVLLLPVLIGWAREPAGDQAGRSWLARHRVRDLRRRASRCSACAISRRRSGWRGCTVRRQRTSSRRSATRQTVLVTGATGFIGTRLVASLTEAGHQVIALVRNPRAGGDACGAAHADHQPRPVAGGYPHRRHRQSRGRADRQRAVDRSQAAQDHRVPRHA